MNDRDHFAAAALTGLVSLNCPGPNQQFPQDLCERAFRWADAMLRERDRTNHDAAPAARGDARECAAPVTAGGTSVGVSATGAGSGSTPDAQGFGRSNEYPCQPFDSAPTTDQERFVRFQSAVMNWISEATGFFHDDVLRTEDARDVISDACSRCWDAFDRIAYPTKNHDAAPAARASEATASPERASARSDAGTGDAHRSVEESSRPRRAHNPEIAGANPAAPTDDAATGEPGGGVGFSPGSSSELINRNAERESPRRECGESSLRDVPRPDTKGKAAGGPEHHISGAEIDALEFVVEDGRIVGTATYGVLRSLLVRLRPEWEAESSDRSQPVKDAESDRSKPISDDRLAALEQLSALDQELEARHGLQGNPMIKARRNNESI